MLQIKKGHQNSKSMVPSLRFKLSVLSLRHYLGSAFRGYSLCACIRKSGKSVNAGADHDWLCISFLGLAIVSFTAVRNPIFTLSVMILRRALSGLNLRTLSTRINTISHFSEILRSMPSILSRKLFPCFRVLSRFFSITAFSPSTMYCRIPHSPVFHTKGIFFEIRHIPKSYKRFALSAR